MRISANLGFLFQEYGLPDAIRAAKRAGFEAVECHWPYEVPVEVVRDALAETGLPMLGLNTVRGGGMGLAVLPDRFEQARDSILQALDYAKAIGCGNVHVMAGIAEGVAACNCFVDALSYATEKAAPDGITILIEPLNNSDVPGYFLISTDKAMEIIGRVGADNLKIMYDLYHMEVMQGDHLATIRELLPFIGHIQFASMPGRGRPDRGVLDFSDMLPEIVALGYQGYFGAEYKPEAAGDFGWLQAFRSHWG